LSCVSFIWYPSLHCGQWAGYGCYHFSIPAFLSGQWRGWGAGPTAFLAGCCSRLCCTLQECVRVVYESGFCVCFVPRAGRGSVPLRWSSVFLGFQYQRSVLVSCLAFWLVLCACRPLLPAVHRWSGSFLCFWFLRCDVVALPPLAWFCLVPVLRGLPWSALSDVTW
jgi:hypothetical protein